ncbi:MAG: hypothetical protein IJW29_10050 [Clostridia bacterium]|nr:hypothetical protein [Clostridia bacterium]
MYKHNHALRYLAVVAVFCVICVVYLGRLFYIQISGREGMYDPEADVEYVKVQAARGEIYDRNGKKLVGNRYTYDLIFSVDFLNLDAQEQNGICLDVLELIEGWEHLRPTVFSPFEEGQEYPFYSYSAGVSSSATHQSVIAWLEQRGLEKNASAQQLAEYYADAYDLLATDEEGRRLYSDTDVDKLIRTYYDMDAHRFYYNGEYTVATGLALSSDGSTDLMTSVLEKTLATVEFKGRQERVYLYPGYASHILGTVGPIYAEEWEDYRDNGYQMDALVGKDGCEAAFEQYLHGTDGLLKVEKGEDGVKITTIREPVAGKDVYLTIDIDLQISAEDALRENVAFVAGTADGAACQAGAVVAIDPETFEVLAIASYPTYDLGTYNENFNDLNADPAKPLTNRTINETYAPGSTLKLGMALIGLNEGKITPSTKIPCSGKYQGVVGCSMYLENHWGAQNVIEAISHSCNSFFCEIGDRFSAEDPLMEDYLSRLGLGQVTGFELGGAKGIMAGPTYRASLNNEEGWLPGMRWQAAIGQSDHKMSPLQLAAYTGTICNGGTRYETRLLHSVHAFGQDEPILYGTSEVLSATPFSKPALDTVKDGMETMIAESSYAIRETYLGLSKLPDNVTVGGKTGTAQVGGDNPDNALFVCSATTDGEEIPDVVISVVLESGAHGYYATRTAGAVLNAFYN